MKRRARARSCWSSCRPPCGSPRRPRWCRSLLEVAVEVARRRGGPGTGPGSRGDALLLGAGQGLAQGFSLVLGSASRVVQPSTASQMAFQCRFSRMALPAASMATFRSSVTFQSTKASMSGWSRSRQTILAARRVVPPLLMAPAARSPTARKLMRPELRPPPERGSSEPRTLEKLVPVPRAVLEDAGLAGPQVHDAARDSRGRRRRSG